MTQQDLNDLANAWDVNDAPISARNLGVLAYEAGFKKALKLIFKEIDSNDTQSHYYAVNAIENNYQQLI